MSGHVRICGTGWGAWQDQADRLAGWAAAWSDVTGAHLSTVPPRAPVGATHLWAWSGEVMARARIDDDEAVVGFLHPAGACPLGAHSCPEAIVSQPRVARSWAEAHVDVADLRDVTWRIIEVVDGVATTFLRPAE